MERKAEDDHAQTSDAVKAGEETPPSQPTSTNQPSSATTVRDAAGDAVPALDETIVDQVKHAVEHVVEGITEGIKSVLHISTTTPTGNEETSTATETPNTVKKSDNNEIASSATKSEEVTKEKKKDEGANARPSSSAKDLLEPDSHESTGRSVTSIERSAAEEEILSTIEHVEDWAEEEESEVEEEEEEEEEEEDEKKSVDLDRDRTKPEYIPRGGAYFMHDDRLATDDEEEEEEDQDEEEDEVEKPEGRAEGTAETGDTERKVPEGAADPTLKSKSKKAPPKKPAPSADTKKPKRERTERTEDDKAEAERWGHDLYDETSQASKSQDEIKHRYGYNIRDDEQAPRGKRPRRYARPAEVRGSGRGSGRGSRGFRGAARGPSGPVGAGGPRGPAAPPTGTADEGEVVEKENHPAPLEQREKPLAVRGASRPARGVGPRPTASTGRGGGQETTRRGPQGYSGYEDSENWQPRQQRRYEDAPPSTGVRGRGGPPAQRRPPPRQAYDEYEAPQRVYQPPRRYPSHTQYEERDEYEGNLGEFQSRVFFSRGRGPRRGGPAPPPSRGPAYHPRPSGAPTEAPRPQPKLPLVAPSRGAEKPFSAQQAPPPSAPPPSKRYSERRGQSIRSDMPPPNQSDDVRSMGMTRGGAGGVGGGASYRMPIQQYPPPGGASYVAAPSGGVQQYDQQGGGGYYAPPPHQGGHYYNQAPYYHNQGGYAGGNGYY